jgi:hypothetical protein
MWLADTSERWSTDAVVVSPIHSKHALHTFDHTAATRNTLFTRFPAIYLPAFLAELHKYRNFRASLGPEAHFSSRLLGHNQFHTIFNFSFWHIQLFFLQKNTSFPIFFFFPLLFRIFEIIISSLFGDALTLH